MGYYTDALAEIRTAIRELVTGGQSVTYQGRSISMANLKDLTELEQSYVAKAAAETNATLQSGRSRIIYVTPRT